MACVVVVVAGAGAVVVVTVLSGAVVGVAVILGVLTVRLSMRDMCAILVGAVMSLTVGTCACSAFRDVVSSSVAIGAKWL